MKHIKIFLLIVSLSLGIKKMHAEKHDVCIKYDTLRTLPQFRAEISSLARQGGSFNLRLFQKYCDIINRALQTSKKEWVRKIVVTPENMLWIIDNSVTLHHSFVNPKDYENYSRLEHFAGPTDGDELVPTDLVGLVSDYAQFVFEDVLIVWCKIACGNPQWIKVLLETFIPPVIPAVTYTPPSPPRAPDTVIKYVYEVVEKKRDSACCCGNITGSFNTTTTTTTTTNNYYGDTTSRYAGDAPRSRGGSYYGSDDLRRLDEYELRARRMEPRPIYTPPIGYYSTGPSYGGYVQVRLNNNQPIVQQVPVGAPRNTDPNGSPVGVPRNTDPSGSPTGAPINHQ
jgi:hypothetical protein